VKSKECFVINPMLAFQCSLSCRCSAWLLVLRSNNWWDGCWNCYTYRMGTITWLVLWTFVEYQVIKLISDIRHSQWLSCVSEMTSLTCYMLILVFALWQLFHIQS